MKLITKEIARSLPPLYSQEDVEDPLVRVKFFSPDSNWTWYVIEAATNDHECSGVPCDQTHRPLDEWDGESDVLFFGLVDGFDKEFGYFRLSELKAVRGSLRLPVERDLSWAVRPVSEIN